MELSIRTAMEVRTASVYSELFCYLHTSLLFSEYIYDITKMKFLFQPLISLRIWSEQ